MRPGMAAYVEFEKARRNKRFRAKRPRKVSGKDFKSLGEGGREVDGDGDGLVYDNTVRERPATPAEIAAGRALRRRRGGAMRTKDGYQSTWRGKPPKKSRPERWVIRGRDENGKVIVQTANTREDAIRQGRDLQGKKLRNVRAIRVGEVQTKRSYGDRRPGDQPKPDTRPQKPSAPKPSAPKKPEPKVPEGTMTDYAQRAHAAIDWPEEFEDRDKVVGANWIAMMTAAIRGDKSAFTENMRNFFESSDNHDQDHYDGLMDKLDEMLGEFITPEQEEALDESFNEWDAFDFKRMREGWRQTGDPYGRAVDLEAVKGTAAHKHLSMGGSIEDAPHEGLIESIYSMPDRFEVRSNGSKSTRTNMWVVDKNGSGKQTAISGENGVEVVDGDVWMLKGGIESHINMDEQGDDQLNELLASELWRGTGVQMADTRISEDANGQRWVMQRHVSQQFGGDNEQLATSDVVMDSEGLLGEFWDNEGNLRREKLETLSEEDILKHVDQEALARLEDKGSVLDMILADYLMGGYDRHGMNWGFHQNEQGGYRLQMWDNGGTFTSVSKNPAIDFLDYIAFNEEALVTNYANVVLARTALGKTPAQRKKAIQKRLTAFIAEVKKIELDKVKGRLDSATLDGKQRKMVARQIKLVEQRIAHLEENIEGITESLITL